MKQPPQKTSPGLTSIDELWPRILMEVKGRRRFAWLLLSEKAKVARFDGNTIQLEFMDESSKGTYRSAGIDSLLEDVIRVGFKMQWQIEVVDRESLDLPTTSIKRPANSQSAIVEPKELTRRPGEWPEIPKPKIPGVASGGSEGFDGLWSIILEAVKERRRFAWILLSQYAEVTRFDGKTLELVFSNDASRQNYLSSGCDEVLEKVLREVFKVPWEVDVSKLDSRESLE